MAAVVGLVVVHALVLPVQVLAIKAHVAAMAARTAVAAVVDMMVTEESAAHMAATVDAGVVMPIPHMEQMRH